MSAAKASLERPSPVQEIRINPQKPFSVQVVPGTTARRAWGGRGHRTPYFMNSASIAPKLLEAWSGIGCEITFVCDQSALDKIDSCGKELLESAFRNTQTVLDSLIADGFAVDPDRVRGLLVEHLSPLDKECLALVGHLNDVLKRGLVAEKQRWFSLMNLAKTLRAPALPAKLSKELESSSDRACCEIQRNIDSCAKAERLFKEEANPVLRRNRNVGNQKAIKALLKLFVESGMKRTQAADAVHLLIKAWDAHVNPSTPSSLRVRSHAL